VGLVVPIRALLDGNGAFSPEDVTVLTCAFESCLQSLGLVDRTDPAVLMVAKRIIRLAEHGKRNARWLTEQALQSFKADPGVSGL
jgi:hypothetical protein